MNEANEPSKVVNLGARLESSNERVGELLEGVRSSAGRRLQLLLANMFEQVDDALFDLAEKADNNAAQMHYFDGMREVRKRRPLIERQFLTHVGRELAGLASHTPARAPAPAPSGPVELSLVAENELEESLAITSMVTKNETRLSRDLFAFNQRLAVICGGMKVDDGNNPLAPSGLAQGFRQAMRELDADARVKLIIYKLFDRYVLSALEELYQEANTLLVRAGVLPQLRHGTARPSTDASETPRSSEPVVPTEEETAVAGELLQTLRALFTARRQAGGGATAGTEPATSNHAPPPTANELLGALSVLQNQLAAAHPAASHQLDAATLSREVAQLKEHLMGQLGALRGERPGQVSSIDEDTIDLVSMLFEFILEDQNLPTGMQVLLARLQIPYLKAAILDRRLFAQRQHPARRLLDGLAELAKGWTAESDRDQRVHEQVKSVVDRLLHDFDDDMGIFERLAAELQDFQDSSRKRAELAEQRVAESARGREKLEQARRRSAREILDRIGSRTLPPLIHGVLARAWANYMVLTILRQGEDSTEFADALRFVNEFIASTQPTPDAESRRTLRRMLPGIERALRKGLANVAFQESDIERLLSQLHTYYRRQLGERVEDAPSDEGAGLAIPESIQPVVAGRAGEHAASLQASDTSDEAEDQVADPIDGSPQMQTVRELKPGVWVEFSPSEDLVERAKLSWISPMSGRYLFVNRRGLKVGDYAPRELARALAAGRARVLASAALFDRAMDAIVDRLSHPPAAEGESSD